VHHHVNYSKYKDNALIPKKGVKSYAETNEYGMRLVNMTLDDERLEAKFEKEQKTVKTSW
jgi:aspartate/tyrosine/aromatic aminotransferase